MQKLTRNEPLRKRIKRSKRTNLMANENNFQLKTEIRNMKEGRSERQYYNGKMKFQN